MKWNDTLKNNERIKSYKGRSKLNSGELHDCASQRIFAKKNCFWTQ